MVGWLVVCLFVCWVVWLVVCLFVFCLFGWLFGRLFRFVDLSADPFAGASVLDDSPLPSRVYPKTHTKGWEGPRMNNVCPI